MNKITVIGGGASGLMAAITAAREGCAVCIVEQNERVGKKILSTGNGRCNFTNVNQEPLCYHSETPLFPWRVIEKFPVPCTISFFLELGLYSKNKNGHLYPQSGQASAVLDVLRMESCRLGVKLLTGQKCVEICPQKRGFLIRTDKETFDSDKVILAAGGKAAPSTGSDGSGYALAKALGHHLVPVLPALAQLRCKEGFYKSLAGIRVDGDVEIYVDGECLARDGGEIQLTNYGISGIPVFQVSRYAAIGLHEKKAVTAVLNFMPDFTGDGLLAFLENRIKTRPGKTAAEFFTGLFHKKLSALWLSLADIDSALQVGDFSREDIQKLIPLIQQFSTHITAVNPFAKAQVCRGGVSTGEVTENMESRLVQGLYFAGEILDVDGQCGGYNLQWAWSSGQVAGREAAHA